MGAWFTGIIARSESIATNFLQVLRSLGNLVAGDAHMTDGFFVVGQGIPG